MSKPKSARLQESLRQPGRLQMSFLLAIMGLLPIELAIIGELRWSAAFTTGGTIILIAAGLGLIEWFRIVLANKRDRQQAVYQSQGNEKR